MSCYEEENPECGNGLRDGCELLQWRYGNASVGIPISLTRMLHLVCVI